ncbi:MAG: hypothetical protein JJU02_15840 [Cryomorphaceae bacterium]|nr:hypothetical protein [Cryomorphaceae bacterium]
MTKYRKIWELIIGISLFVGVVFTGVKAREYFGNSLVEDLYIHIENHPFAAILQEDDLLEKMDEVLGSGSAIRTKETNIGLLEEILDDFPHIRKSEVFSSLAKELHAHVRVRVPIARVFENKRSFYLDENGAEMPLSEHYTAPVILVTGKYQTWERRNLVDLIERLSADSFFADNISGIDVSENGICTLLPKTHRFNVVLGSEGNIEERLLKLKAFWMFGLHREKVEQLAKIDLRFNQQVICQY